MTTDQLPNLAAAYEAERRSSTKWGAELEFIDWITHEIGCPGFVKHGGFQYSVAINDDGFEYILRIPVRGYPSVV